MASRTLCRVGTNVLLRRVSPAVTAPLMTRNIVVAASPFTVRLHPMYPAVALRLATPWRGIIVDPSRFQCLRISTSVGLQAVPWSSSRASSGKA
jgi:hypothetical protein